MRQNNDTNHLVNNNNFNNNNNNQLFICWQVKVRRGRSVGDCDVPGSTATIGMRVRQSGRLLSYLALEGHSVLWQMRAGLQQCTPYQIIYKTMALGAAWITLQVCALR